MPDTTLRKGGRQHSSSKSVGSRSSRTEDGGNTERSHSAINVAWEVSGVKWSKDLKETCIYIFLSAPDESQEASGLWDRHF